MQLTSILPFGFIAGTMALPKCTNGGTLYCCQATVAGDVRLIQFLANAVDYKLTPNDINCIEGEKTQSYPGLRPSLCWVI